MKRKFIRGTLIVLASVAISMSIQARLHGSEDEGDCQYSDPGPPGEPYCVGGLCGLLGDPHHCAIHGDPEPHCDCVPNLPGRP